MGASRSSRGGKSREFQARRDSDRVREAPPGAHVSSDRVGGSTPRQPFSSDAVDLGTRKLSHPKLETDPLDADPRAGAGADTGA